MILINAVSAGLRRALRTACTMVLIIALLAPTTWLWAQESSSQTPQQTSPQVPEAGGPQGDVGPYNVPKKKEEPPPERVRPPKNPPEIGEFSITKDVSLVNVPVIVTTKDGQFIPNLKKEHFRVLEDGVPQQISGFNLSEAPITAVLLVEFAATNYGFMIDALNASYAFAQTLKKDDWVAVVSYDMKPHILTDFTQDKNQVMAALNMLRIPGFRETNLFDALYDTIDRLEGIEGRKYIILVSSGRDTFSKLTFDKILKRVQGTKDITIFAISTGQAFRLWVESHCTPPYCDQVGLGIAMMDYLQADNEMRTFAKLTGGQAYFPRFTAEFPEIFRDIGASIRNQYVLTYHPSNPKLDGTYRKLKIEIVDPQSGGPLKVVDQKGKQLKYTIIAREGYTARHQVE
ncbi:MAG: VWA domain-containing protein [Terriglobales bacterium]